MTLTIAMVTDNGHQNSLKMENGHFGPNLNP